MIDFGFSVSIKWRIPRSYRYGVDIDDGPIILSSVVANLNEGEPVGRGGGPAQRPVMGE